MLVERAAPISAVRVLPLHPQLVFGPWQCCLCDSVVPVAAAAQRSQLPLPQHLGVPVPGHFQEDPRRQTAPAAPPPQFASAGPASHPGRDVHGVQAAGQCCLQVPQRVQALHLAVPAVDELLERVLLQQGAHVLEEEALAERGQFWCVVNLRKTAGSLTPSACHRST